MSHDDNPFPRNLLLSVSQVAGLLNLPQSIAEYLIVNQLITSWEIPTEDGTPIYRTTFKEVREFVDNL